LQLVQEREGNNLEEIGKARTSSVELQQPETKRKGRQMGLHKIKKLLYEKRNAL
jgi:hypothetical protein